jgi:hypothetical protein
LFSAIDISLLVIVFLITLQNAFQQTYIRGYHGLVVIFAIVLTRQYVVLYALKEQALLSCLLLELEHLTFLQTHRLHDLVDDHGVFVLRASSESFLVCFKCLIVLILNAYDQELV